MSSTPPTTFKKTALNDRHRALGARMIEFGGWEMPVEYSGISDEHLAVRTRAGLFDGSHMGQIELAGGDALGALQWVTCNDAARLAVGRAQYTAITTPDGTFVDDVIVYRLGADHFMLVVNAANIQKDYRWLSTETRARGRDLAIVNASARYALLALQGPLSESIVQPLTDLPLADLRYYWFTHGEVAGIRATVSRTGYTGEDGFEILCPPQQAGRLWDALLDAGRSEGVVPCGLGARDTLRLEACMRLYGQEMDEGVTVLEAGLGWIVAWNKGEFLGRDRLEQQKQEGVTRRIVAFEMTDRGIARAGCPVIVDGRACGTVTSGTRTPFLKKAVGLAMVPVAATAPGSRFDVDIRGRLVGAEVVQEPFYKRPPRAPQRIAT